MLAVCRGKISEGIDFADDAARIVITIGIPYPAAMDPVTKAKKEYNDLICKTTTKNAINGHRWYEIQAFRAINQERLKNTFQSLNNFIATLLLE